MHLHDPFRLWLHLRDLETLSVEQETAFGVAEETLLRSPVTSTMQAVSVIEVAILSLSDGGGRVDGLDLLALARVKRWLAAFVSEDLLAMAAVEDPIAPGFGSCPANRQALWAQRCRHR